MDRSSARNDTEVTQVECQHPPTTSLSASHDRGVGEPKRISVARDHRRGNRDAHAPGLRAVRGILAVSLWRLMQRFQDHRDPHVISAFNKLATILPPPVA